MSSQDYQSETVRFCPECQAPLGHSRSCPLYDGYTMTEYLEHEADGDAVLMEEESWEQD